MSKHEREWNLAKLEAETFDRDVLGELIRCGARQIQKEEGLKEDGLCGPMTVSAIEERITEAQTAPQWHDAEPPQYQVPIPRRNAIADVYGSFRYSEHPDTPGAVIIEKAWVQKNITRVTLHTGQKVWIHRAVAFEMAELYEKACRLSGYTPGKVACWVARHMRWQKSRPLSRHSWGIAFDIDWHLNGIRMTDTPLHRHPEWVSVFKDAGWTWGGDWRSYPDPMHFERTRR